MGIVNGNVVIRVGSEDPIILQLLEDDGETAINLTGITALQLRLVNQADSTDLKNFADPDIVVSDATNGKVKLSQAAADFTSAKVYDYFVQFTDADGNAIKIPEDKNYTFTVIDSF